MNTNKPILILGVLGKNNIKSKNSIDYRVFFGSLKAFLSLDLYTEIIVH